MPPRLAAGHSPDLTVVGHGITELTSWELADVGPGETMPAWDEAVPARAPGTVAQALVAAGRPTDGVDERDWWYRCATTMPRIETGEEAVLRFDGLATHASVLVDDTRFERHSMFVPCAVVLGPRAAAPEVALVFHALGPRLRERHPRPRWKTRIVDRQSLRWHRTQLLGRCPGFAPGPPVVGPWRPVLLERRRRIAIDGLRLRPALDETGMCHLDVRVALRGLDTEVRGVVCTVGGLSNALELRRETTHLVATGSVRGRLAPWWPHTHGEPALHDVHLLVETADGEVEVAARPVGFRRVMVRDPERFSLEINGARIFCRGGSLMPDPLSVDSDAEREERLLRRTVDAGMNMIRLPGVSHYAHRRLLGRADALGLLVWQDFAFANMDYPVEDDRFRALVEEEAASFLEDAGAHASLATLCGGSEIEQQVAMLGLEATFPLLDEVLPAAIDAAEVDVPYVRSTPTGGSLPFRADAGVAHYFGVGAYRRPLEDARRAAVRFAVECLAFANVPRREAVEEIGFGSPTWQAGIPRDNGTDWTFADVTDHYLQALFDVDPASLRENDPERYLALAATTTGEVMAAVLGEWRRSDSTCGGALIWCLNDLAPGPGWGILDVDCEPKPAYWAVRRALQPFAAWLTDEGTNGIRAHVANDSIEPVEAVLTVTLARADGAPCAPLAVDVALPPRSTTSWDVESLLGGFADVGHAFGFGTPTYSAVAVDVRTRSGVCAHATHFVDGYPVVGRPLPDAEVQATLARRDDGCVELTLGSAEVVHAVEIEAGGLEPDDNLVTLVPGTARTVVLRPPPGAPPPRATWVRVRAPAADGVVECLETV